MSEIDQVEVITLSHTLLGSPQGVLVEQSYYSTSPSGLQGLPKDFIGSPQGVLRDSSYNPHNEGTL